MSASELLPSDLAAAHAMIVVERQARLAAEAEAATAKAEAANAQADLSSTGRIWLYVRDDRPFGGHWRNALSVSDV